MLTVRQMDALVRRASRAENAVRAAMAEAQERKRESNSTATTLVERRNALLLNRAAVEFALALNLVKATSNILDTLRVVPGRSTPTAEV